APPMESRGDRVPSNCASRNSIRLETCAPSISSYATDRGKQLFCFDRALLLADCDLHIRYLVLLSCDDVLSKPPKLLVMTIFEFGPRHIDRPLMMGDHHGDEVAIYVARRLDEHAPAHLAHGEIIVEQELLLVGIGDRCAAALQICWILSQGEGGCRD